MRKNSFLKKHHTIIVLFFSILVGLLLLRYILSDVGRVPQQDYKVLKNMTVEVKHEDGSIDNFKSYLFNFSSDTDRITLHLPLEKEWAAEYQTINFFFYNSIVKAYYKDKLLISYGENLKRHMIGHLKISIPVPMEAYGEEIRVEIAPQLGILEDHFDVPVLMSKRSEFYYPMIHQETTYPIFVMTLIGSFIGVIIFAFFFRSHVYASEGMWLFALVFAITLWHLGNSGVAYLLFASEDLSAVCEYIGMYLLFASAPLYASYETARPWVKNYLRSVGIVLFAFFFLCLALYILPTGFQYTWNLRWMQGLQIVMVFSAVISLLFPGKRQKNNADYILAYGLVFVAVFGLLEQIRIILAASVTEKWPAFLQSFVTTPFSKILILLLIIVFITSYVFKVILISQASIEEKHLKYLAYTDRLTGLGNRQYLQDQLEVLDHSKKKDYAAIFMDINDLKLTNDLYGHESGDRLIQIVADAIREAMDDVDGFSGRNGGDEFICVIFPASSVFMVEDKIKEYLKLAKAKEKPPFPVSISMGSASYREVAEKLPMEKRTHLTVSHVIRQADGKMYDDKYRMKKSRDHEISF